MSNTNYLRHALAMWLGMIVVLVAGPFLLPGNAGANSFSIVFEKNNQPSFRTWESKDKDIAIDFPTSWTITSQTNDRGVTLSKSDSGWFRLRLIDLPTGETLAGFSKHLIDRSTSEDWDIEFRRDDGTQTIGGKACRVHQYRHKKNKRLYTGYSFINSNGKTGIQILIHAANNSAKVELLAIVNTLRFSGSPTSRPPGNAQLPDIYTHFGPQISGGNFTGHVFFKGRKNKSYPVYIAFYPVLNRQRKIKDRNEVKVAGPVQYTATDHRGNYTINLDPETKKYFVELYNAEGRRWEVRKGLKLIKHSKASKFHHFKINN